MKTKRKKFSAKQLFNLIDSMLEEKGLKPDILDYGLGGDASQMILSEEFDAVPRVTFGGSEGIYLDITLEGSERTFSTGKDVLRLGTYKTLGTTKEDYIKMSLLGVEFVFALRDYVEQHMDEFNWTGYDISLFRDDENPAGKIWTLRSDRALEIANDFLAKYPDGLAVIRDNETEAKEHVSQGKTA